jgi:two-component system, NtrC family, response regulator
VVEPLSVLLVDDDDSLRRVTAYHLEGAGYRVASFASPKTALDALRERPFSLIVTDLLMPEMDGIELLEAARVLRPDTAVVVITAHGDVATAVRAMQLGALDFVEKPFSKERLLVALQRAAEFLELRDENRRLRAVVQQHGSFENILGSSAALKAALADLRLAAASEATVLITGESGTGKELAARAIHLNSPRKGGPFVVVNCAAIPENLIESQLFGHRRGAFTGATEDRKGKFEVASGGTLLLDEVAELPLQLQPRLLRALQEGEIDKIGATSPIHVDVRLVAATNHDLQERVHEGSFREDLFYRLNVVPLRMPALRERREDIPLLSEHFLVKHAKRHERPVPRLAPEVLALFDAYDWPGNIRELENLLERMVVLARGDTITLDDVPETMRREQPRYGGVRMDLPAAGIRLEEVERGLLEEALRRSAGNRSAAARYLGISRQTLLYRMGKFDLH